MVDGLVAQQKIAFEPGNAAIAPVSQPTLKGIARALTRCGAIPFEVGGHTDAQGRDEMNLALSQARAEAVVQALVSLGVPAAGLSAMGYGEAQPIADNKTDAGREANRRIVFRLLLSDAEAGAVAQATVAADAAPPPVEGLVTSGSDAASDVATDRPVTEAATADSSGTAADATSSDSGVIVRPADETQMRPKPRPKAP